MGAPGKGVEHARADCPVCGRAGVPGGVDHETGHVILRRHKWPNAHYLCSGGRRVDAGPASPLLDSAFRIAKGITEQKSAEES
jgi:hypothetical protein